MGRNKIRAGFLLKHRVKTIFRSPAIYRRLIGWAHRLRTRARAMVACRITGPGRGYSRVGHDPVIEGPGHVPKGRMAVYVGRKDGEFQRILVPVVYFNHPLFGDLLRESENEYGFDQPGGLTIPCRVSEFERVQTRIEAGRCDRKVTKW